MAKKSNSITNEPVKTFPEKITQRLTQIRFRIEELKTDGLFVNYLPNIRYLTNFSGSSASMIIFQDSIWFFTDDRYEEQVQTELYPLPNLQIHITRDIWNYLIEKKLLKDINALAFEAEKLSYQEVINIRNLIRPVKFKPGETIVEPYTMPKSPEELENIKKACAMSEEVFNIVLKNFKPGMTEKELAAEIVYYARKLGSEGEPFPTIVVSGKRSSMPHGSPTDKQIKANEVVTVDFGCVVNGFCSDITRVFAVGKYTKEQKSIYELLIKAKENAIAQIRPFVNGKLVDQAARSMIAKAGYGDFFQHSLGHGIGIMPHEMPLITFRKENEIIPEGCALAIEPGIYIPNKYGMRVEDNVYVAKDSAKHLTKAPEELIVI
ncbi:aminopeptidase P family protein [Bacteroidetes/Chlorobi group bacterium MS-B_bin-24]|jgi:Xaa-Pro aminopeptidase|nr:MAG: aminopeptidase P family protein [Bacteroidetes/Chlorobi group bacterium MS-B_bin-24]